VDRPGLMPAVQMPSDLRSPATTSRAPVPAEVSRPRRAGEEPELGPPLERLQSPPINEVICGLIFPSISQLDPVFLGTYWEPQREEFPFRQLQPALTDQPSITLGGTPPLRVWLISKDDVFVIQVQHDRFYLNWRARGGAYPRFSDRPEGRGLLSLLLDKFAGFTEFCSRRVGDAPKPTQIELTKVDHLVQGRHWSDFQDLAKMIPWFGDFASFSKLQTNPSVAMRFAEPRENGTLAVSLESAAFVNPEGSISPILKMETRLVADLGGRDLRTAFSVANYELNKVFAKLIPETQRRMRFSGSGK